MHIVIRAAAVLALLMSFQVAGKSKLVAEAGEPSLAPEPGKAVIVFMRSSFVGSAIQSSVYDITGDQEQFIGVVSNKTRVAHQVEPGEHRFMVVAENADFMDATIEAGKTYYALISPRPGVWKARFSLLPIRNDASAKYNLQSKDFSDWMEKGKRVVMTPAADAWYEKNRASIAKKRSKFLEKWDAMAPADKANLTLRAEDGI